VAVGVAALALGCVDLGRGRDKMGATVRAPVASRDVGPAAPSRGLAFPGLDLAWTPPMATAGDVGALAAALARFPEITLQLGPRLAGTGWQQRATTLVETLSPNTRVAAQRAAGLDAQLEPGPALSSPGRSVGPAGRPRYATPALRATWSKGQVGALLGIDDAAVSASAWQALPAVSVGSCEPAMQALAEGQELALVQLEPFLAHADTRLAASHRAQLRAHVPGMQAELAASAARSPGVGPQRTLCVQAYSEQLAAFTDCLEGGSCPGAPKMTVMGGLGVALPEARTVIPEGCAAQVGRDYAADLRRLAQASVTSVTAALDPGWVMLADRLGKLLEVHAALEDICTPRRRRFAEADLAEARRRLARIGVALASDDHRGDGRWQIEDEVVYVPGLGASRGLARFAAGTDSINAGIVTDARALRDFVIGRSMCRSGHASAPLTVLLAAPQADAGEVAFFGYFYEEELFCGALPPLGPAT